MIVCVGIKCNTLIFSGTYLIGIYIYCILFCECGCSLCLECHPSTAMRIVPAALEGSNVHSTHHRKKHTWRSQDAHVEYTAHAHILERETEREAISSVPPHAEWFTVRNLFHMVPCTFLLFLYFSFDWLSCVCVHVQEAQMGKNLWYVGSSSIDFFWHFCENFVQINVSHKNWGEL